MAFSEFRRFSAYFNYLLMIYFASGCAPEKLLPLAQLKEPDLVKTTEIQGDFCTLNLTTTSDLKFYFVIDVTGSNNQTDPGRVKRTAAMRAMLDKYPNSLFALQTFAGEPAGPGFKPR
jgi:hypothetical protein